MAQKKTTHAVTVESSGSVEHLQGVLDLFEVLLNASQVRKNEQAIAELKQKETGVKQVHPLLVCDIGFGEYFKRVEEYSIVPLIYRRIRPTSYLLNSSLVQENLARGNVLVLNDKEATCWFLPANKSVVRCTQNGELI